MAERLTGEGTPNATPERTYLILWDTNTYAVSTALADKEFWISSDQNKTSASYRSDLITNVAQQKALFISFLKMTHNLLFTQTASEPQGSILHYFENYSRLKLEILEKNYPDINLALMLPYDRYYDGANWAAIRKPDDKFKLPEMIKIPNGGNIHFTFKPCSVSLSTAATATTIPIMFDLAFTSNKGFGLLLQAIGIQDRRSA